MNWIDIDHELPKELEPVLIWFKNYPENIWRMAEGFYCNGKFHLFCGCTPNKPSMWSVLPDGPTGRRNEQYSNRNN